MKNIASLIKKLVILNETRNNLVINTCPVMTPDIQERMKYFREIAETQKKIDVLINDIRNFTGNIFIEFTDVELAIACYFFASIWADEGSIRSSSRDFMDIVGRNRISELPILIENLQNGKSALNKYVNMIWHNSFGRLGCYMFEMKDSKAFIALFIDSKKVPDNE